VGCLILARAPATAWDRLPAEALRVPRGRLSGEYIPNREVPMAKKARKKRARKKSKANHGRRPNS
jgi:hypothetical protein